MPLPYGKERAWAEISLSGLENNYQSIRKHIGKNCQMMCVVKGDAYGHGLMPVSLALERYGADAFAVATIQEAIALRDAGISRRILILGPLDPLYYKAALDYGIDLQVQSLQIARDISDAARAYGKRANIHIKLDTGTGRFGFQAQRNQQQTIEEILQLCQFPYLNPVGIFTHVCVANDPTQDEFTHWQMKNFHNVTSSLEACGLHLIRHCANSPVTVRMPEYHDDMVRVGTAICGFDNYEISIGTHPILSLKSRIISLHDLEPGDTLSYGRLYTAQRRTRIATIPFGYGDGLSRCCTNRLKGLLHGQLISSGGKICMDYTFFDVTDIPDAALGDIVTLIGQDGTQQLSPYAITNLYPGSCGELTCMLTQRIPKFYV